jgi:putative transcriptional regulator
MQIDQYLTDNAVLEELGERISRTRLERNITQAELGEQAGLGVATIQRLERGDPVSLITLIRVLRALGLLTSLDQAVHEPLPSPLEQLKLRGARRQRARQSHSAARAPDDQQPWRWADDVEGT